MKSVVLKTLATRSSAALLSHSSDVNLEQCCVETVPEEVISLHLRECLRDNSVGATPFVTSVVTSRQDVYLFPVVPSEQHDNEQGGGPYKIAAFRLGVGRSLTYSVFLHDSSLINHRLAVYVSVNQGGDSEEHHWTKVSVMWQFLLFAAYSMENVPLVRPR